MIVLKLRNAGKTDAVAVSSMTTKVRNKVKRAQSIVSLETKVHL